MQEFNALRPSAFAIAYRMLGSASEAENVVQEGFLRLHRARADGERTESPRAYLSTVVSRMALDQLRSARVRRETYVGEWLPEPLLTSADDDPVRQAETADSLSLAFLVVLESLSPSSAPRSCSRTCSTTATRRSRRSSAPASRTPASSPPGPAATCSSGVHGSRPHATSASSSRPLLRGRRGGRSARAARAAGARRGAPW